MVFKKGQLAGILLICAILFIAYLGAFNSTFHPPEIRYSQVDFVQVYTQVCLEQALDKSLILIGQHGGYYHPLPRNYYYDSSITMPSLETINQELTLAVSDHFLGCLQDYSSFEDQGVDVEPGQLQLRIDFGEKKVIAEARYPLVITKGQTETDVSLFRAESPLDFKHKYELIEDLILKQSETKSLPIGYLSQSAHDNQFMFEVANTGPTEALLTFIFSDMTASDRVYRYSFMVRWGAAP